MAAGDAAARSGPFSSVAAGRYQLKRFLGEGARKRVYLARDTRLDRDVALALIKTDGLDESGLTRARREAEAMGRLGDHPHIVTIFDIGDDKGQLYIVSQHMSGGSLDEVLQRSADHRLPIPEATRIAGEICRGLEHAHGHGVVHRDIKPQNVWLTEGGIAKLGDFGLAIARDHSRLTLEGMMVGTVAYMSPEQALGRPLDGRSDLYSLGVVLYELLCGRQPFVGDDPLAVLSQHVNTPPVAPTWHNAEVPTALGELILGLLAKDAGERPEDPRVVSEALAAVRGGDAAVAAPAASQQEQAQPLERLLSGVFVGRERETKELRSSFQATLAGRGRVVVVGGETGVGKTRIVGELATYAGVRGAQVLWGRCYEGEGFPPYWPWLQMIRAYVQDRDAEALAKHMGSGAAEIAQLVSEVKECMPGLATPPALEPAQARFRLFSSIGSFLRNAARAQPLVLILDDLQWADPASLLLLRFLTAELHDSCVLVLVTYRESELYKNKALSEALVALRREQVFQRVRLRGLAEDDVRALLEAVAQHELGPREIKLARALHQQTEGNPFFIEEILRHLLENDKLQREAGRWMLAVESTEDLGIPAGIRGTIERRLDRLSHDCRDLLGWASVIGREFRVDLLGRLTQRPVESLLPILDEALQADIIFEAGRHVGRYRFSHGLMRDVLYDELRPVQRIQRHAATGDALSELYANDLERHSAELAAHFHEAIPLRGADPAIEYSLGAARRESGMLAFEDAVRHFEQAIDALPLKSDTGPEEWCELLLELGDAQQRSGDTATGKSTLRAAAERARQLRSGPLLARVAIAYGGGLGGFGVANRADHVLVELLESATALLADEDGPLRAAVLARLAVELYYDHRSPVARRDALSAEAVAMAARLGDPRAQLIALYSRHWSLLGPDGLQEQLAATDSMLGLARAAKDPEMAFYAHHFRLHALLQLADIPSVDAEIQACARLAEQLRQPLFDWWIHSFRAMRALLQADIATGARLTSEALSVGQRVHPEAAMVHHGVQLYIQYWMQGRLAELEPVIRDLAEQYPWSNWRAGVAFIYSELDDEEKARAQLDSLAERDFADLPRDGNWLLGLTLLGATCAYLQDATRARILYELLLPYERRNAVGVAGAGCIGVPAPVLGMLARTLGRSAEAAQHFAIAIEYNDRDNNRAMLALSLFEYAGWLLTLQDPQARPKAAMAIDRALKITATVGMPRLTEKLLKLKFDDQGLTSASPTTSIEVVASSVELERPELVSHASGNGMLTILFSDIVDSTALAEKLGDRDWHALLRSHNTIVRQQVRRHGGFEVKTQGDGFMVTFQAPRNALLCARDIQRALAHGGDHGIDERLRVRIGLHAGEVIRDLDDFFGRNVILAARIASTAQGGEVLVSSLVRELVAETSEFAFEDTWETELKGFAGKHLVSALICHDEPNVESSIAARVSGGEERPR